MVFDGRSFRQSRQEGLGWPGRALQRLGSSALSGFKRTHIAQRRAQEQPILDARVAGEQIEIGRHTDDAALTRHGTQRLGRIIERAIADPEIPAAIVDTVMDKVEALGVKPTELNVRSDVAQLMHGRADSD